MDINIHRHTLYIGIGKLVKKCGFIYYWHAYAEKLQQDASCVSTVLVTALKSSFEYCTSIITSI
jgi:hypothetical protein